MTRQDRWILAVMIVCALALVALASTALRHDIASFPITKVAPETCEHNGRPVAAHADGELLYVTCSNGIQTLFLNQPKGQ